MSEVKGRYEPQFFEVAELLKKHVAAGQELGAAICVNIDGKDVIDIWGGWTDATKSKEWQYDTIVNVWSTTKTVTALAALMLVDRGLIDLDAPVARYWPEFAANGKHEVKVRQILSHTSGICGWERKVSWQDICDNERASDLLAAQKLWFEPGTQSGYEALNMGHLVGPIIKRVTGKSLKQFVADEITGPLGADFQIGAVEKDWDRIALLTPPPLPPKRKISRESVLYKTMANPLVMAEVAHTPTWRRSDLGGCNGHGNARAVARTLSPISLGGTAPGLSAPLLSPETIAKIFAEQAFGEDLVIGDDGPLRWGVGFGLAGPGTAHHWLPSGRICFWSGWGGSCVIMDLDRRMTIAYTMNKMDLGTLGGPRTHAYVRAVYRALGVNLVPDNVPIVAKI